MIHRRPQLVPTALLAAALLAGGAVAAGDLAPRGPTQDAAAREPRVIEVKAGDSWESLATTAAAGDEIVLLEGLHRAVTLTGLRGTAQHPIVIRSR